MPKSKKPFLVDVNVWVAISHASHVHHQQSLTWYDTVDTGHAFLCRHTQLGFLRLLTNNRLMGDYVLSLSQAWQTYDQLVQDFRVSFLHEPTGIDATLRRLTQSSRPSTNIWSDAYLAAIAESAGLTVVTLDRAFAALRGVDSVLI